MANQLLYSDKILRINDFSLLGMVQSEDWSPTFNATDVFELGRESKLDTGMELEVSGSFEMLTIGGLPGVLARMIVARNSSGDFGGYVYNSGGAPTSNTYGVSGAGGKNAYTITESALKEVIGNLVEHERSDNATFDRTKVFPRIFLSNISGRADANGYASETIAWQGDYVIGAKSPYHDIRVLHGIRASGTTFNIKDVYTGANWVGTNYAIMYIYVNERRFRSNTSGDADFFTFTTPASGLCTLTSASGFTLAASDLITAIMYKSSSPSSTFPTLAASDRFTTPFYMRGYQIDLFIGPSSTFSPVASEQWLKVQSIDWTIDPRVEALRQIAFNTLGSTVFARVPTYPINVSVNASVFETDWADWKQVLLRGGRTFPGNNVYQDVYDLAPPSLNTFSVHCKYKTKAGVTVQQLVFDDLRVDGYGNRVNVGGRAEVTWSFTGTSFQLDGGNA